MIRLIIVWSITLWYIIVWLSIDIIFIVSSIVSIIFYQVCSDQSLLRYDVL